MREYGHSGKCFLKHGKSYVCLVGKLECDSFVGESGEQYNNVRIVENEATVKISEAEEGLNILYFLWLGPILNYLNFCLVYGESLGRQDVPKVLYLLRVKLTFVGVGKEPMLAKVSEHFFDMFAMIRGIVRINEDVVKIDDDGNINHV